MKIIKVLKENNKFKVEVKYSGEKWEKSFKKEYDTAAKKVKVEGFRPGKVPANIIKKYINTEEIAYKLVSKSTNEILELVSNDKEFLKEKEGLFSKPHLNINKFNEKEAIIELTYDFYPTLTNDVDYTKIKLYETKPESVSEEEIQKEIDSYKEKNSKLVESKDTELKEGQTAVFDFNGFLDGEEFPGGKAENYELEIGSNQFIPGFEEQMIGMSVGSEKDINVKFPESYHEKSLAGKDVVFKIKLHSIKEKASNELTEEDIKELKIVGVENLSQLKEFIKNSLLESIKSANKELILRSAIEYSNENAEFSEISQNIIENELDNYMKSLELYWEQRGISLDYLLKATNKSLKEFRESQLDQVINQIKTITFIKYIAKKEKIEVNETDYENEIKKLSKQYHVEENIVRDRLEANKDKIMEELLIEKVVERIFDLNKKNERVKVESHEHHHDDECDCGHEH